MAFLRAKRFGRAFALATLRAGLSLASREGQHDRLHPNLPALISALPGDHTRAPQTEFTRARQVLFIENLSVTGSARSASAAAGVSHQTAYRARLVSAVPARLGCGAGGGAAVCGGCAGQPRDRRVTEEVRYHGEVVGTRTRYSDRLLLAHLARLDRLGETRDAAAFAEDWDAVMARFASAEEPLPGEGPIFSSGPCNTRSMSPAARHAGDAVDETEDDGGTGGYEDCDEHDDNGYGPPEDYADLLAGESRREARLVDRLLGAMARRRPADAPWMPERWSASELEDE